MKKMPENKVKKGEVYFLRHAESRYNAGFPDEFNCDLSDNGKKQASNLIGNIDLVIVSPLKRAIETLKNSKINYKKLLTCSLCRENRNTPKCDYLEGEEMFIESREQLLQRIEEFKHLLDLLSENYNRILIVSHGIFICNLVGRSELHNCEFLQWERN